MNIAGVLRDRARILGDRPAIVERRGQVSFEDLDRAAARVAAALEAAGIRPADRVLVVHPMSTRLYAVLIGLFRLLATAMFVDPSLARRHLDRCCELAQPRGFIASAKGHVMRLASDGIRRIPIALAVGGWVPGARSLDAGEGHCERERIECVAAETPALLTFTSGSTATPKGAVRTHGLLLAQHHVLEQTLERRAGAVDLTALPVFVLSNLASGVTSLIPDADLRRPGAIDPVPLMRQIDRHRPASVVASPALLDRLASHAQASGGSLGSFEHIFTGGAPVFPRLLRKLRETATRAAITSVYGSTEAEPIAHVESSAIEADDFAMMRRGAGLLAGRPVPAIELRVIPDRWGRPIGPFDGARFEAEALDPGHIGEIVVAGAHVLAGYLHGVGDGETKCRVGDRIWHRTGDAGYLDARGRLWLMGRCGARIDHASGPLYPFAAECPAQDTPGVARAALVERGGEPVLVTELEADAPRNTRAVLIDALRGSRVADVLVVREIPVDRRHNAKVDYPKLRRLVS